LTEWFVHVYSSNRQKHIDTCLCVLPVLVETMLKLISKRRDFDETKCAHGTVTPTLLPVNVLDIRNMGHN